MEILISDIIIKNRQRTSMDDAETDQLAESVRLIGLINPVVINEDNTLIAGERRIRAYQKLGRTTIEATFKKDLTPFQRKMMEYEENIRRVDLPYADKILAEEDLHNAYVEEYGKTKTLSGRDTRNVWKVEDTAALLGISLGSMSERLQLARAIRKNPELGEFKSESQAKSALRRKQELIGRKLIAAITMQEAPPPETQSTWPNRIYLSDDSRISLVEGDSRDYLKHIEFAYETYDCLLTDPPWQVEYDDNFMDTTGQDIFQLIGDVLTLVKPKLSDGSLCWMFCATKHLIKGTIHKLVLDCGYAIYDQVLIWYKPRVAHTSHPYDSLKNDYEPCLFFSKGKGRALQEPMYAVQEALIKGRRVHPAQKPDEVLETIIKNSTVENELILDPFAGSGRVGIVAQRLKRRAVLIEKEQDWFDTIVADVSGG